jgi:hypothetical protein
MNSQLIPRSHHTVQFLKDYGAEQARAADHVGARRRGDWPWLRLAAAVVSGAVVLIAFAFFVAVARDGHPGQQHGCYVDRYAQPAGYSACSTAPVGSSQALALERR